MAGLKDAGLNLQERGILLTLACGSAKTPAALAKRLCVHPARVTRVLDKLETSGLVERARNGTDRRLVDVSLTREGRAVAARNADVAPGAWSERLSHFSKSDFDALSTLLSRLLHGEGGNFFTTLSDMSDNGPCSTGHLHPDERT
ncbi:MarR family winged helix-turn-helix transcriptional regulator [Paraburkholderia heleia]|uniref:MarR family winged helix-turn-helix transcriptional regulator n=1 Tax=Paraburkholderia heleia TaxID=634127 RepID=UPI002AB74AD5|nr:MarR family transcriptional regulator [Paraburkholderia heleia]